MYGTIEFIVIAYKTAVFGCLGQTLSINYLFPFPSITLAPAASVRAPEKGNTDCHRLSAAVQLATEVACGCLPEGALTLDTFGGLHAGCWYQPTYTYIHRALGSVITREVSK